MKTGNPKTPRKIRCVVVDDEERARATLIMLLQRYCPEAEVVGEADSVDAAIKVIRELKPDLVFLDIEIIGGTGFDVLDQLKPYEFSVVFTTAYQKYGTRIAAQPHAAVIYKPMDIGELQRAVKALAVSLE